MFVEGRWRGVEQALCVVGAVDGVLWAWRTEPCRVRRGKDSRLISPPQSEQIRPGRRVSHLPLLPSHLLLRASGQCTTASMHGIPPRESPIELQVDERRTYSHYSDSLPLALHPMYQASPAPAYSISNRRNSASFPATFCTSISRAPPFVTVTNAPSPSSRINPPLTLTFAPPSSNLSLAETVGPRYPERMIKCR